MKTIANKIVDYIDGADQVNVEDGPFKGLRFVPQPDQFIVDRRDLGYRAQNGDDTGDVLVVNGEDHIFSPRAFKSLINIVDLKTPAWFTGNFDTDTRDKMFKEIIAEKDKLDLRFFYQDVPEGRRIINVLPTDKIILSDAELVKALSEVIPPSVADVADMTFKYYDGSLTIKFTIPNELAVDPDLGDVVRMGAVVHNSQVGFSSPKADGFVYRLSCKNGATTKSRLDAWARGDAADAVTRTDLKEWYRTTIREVLNEQQYFLDRAVQSSQTPATATLLHEISAENKLSAPVVKAIYQAYMKEPGIRQFEDGEHATIWSISNAFTRAAHEGNFDEGTQRRLEDIGGGLVFGRN